MPTDAPELAVCLTDDHWRSRQKALEKFQELDEDAGKLVFNRLRATLSDGNLRVRRAGAHTLAGMCLPEVWGKKPASFAAQAVSELTYHLADADPLVRKAAQEPLLELQKKAIVGDVVVAGQAALPLFKARLRDEDWQVRDATLRALGRLGVGALSCAKDMAMLLTDDSAVCRESAKKALEAMQGSGLAAADFKVVVPPNVEVYLQALRNQDPKVRCAACWVLSYSAPAVVNLKGMADVLVQESNQVLLSVCAECMSLLKLGMLPAAPELVLCLKSFMSDAQSKLRAKNAPGAALMHLHQEVVMVIGRALSKDPKIKEQLPRAQHSASRLGHHLQMQRDEGVAALMQCAPTHVATITELLRIVLDPECPGAQAGMISFLAASSCLDSLRDGGLLGGLAPHCDVVQELLNALEDPSWTVRLAAAESLTTLTCQIRPFLFCLRKHRKSEHHECKVAAQKLWQSIDAGKVMAHAKSMSENAIKVMRGLIASVKIGELKDGDRQFIRMVTSNALNRLVEAGVIEKSELNQNRGRHAGRLVLEQ